MVGQLRLTVRLGDATMAALTAQGGDAARNATLRTESPVPPAPGLLAPRGELAGRRKHRALPSTSRLPESADHHRAGGSATGFSGSSSALPSPDDGAATRRPRQRRRALLPTDDAPICRRATVRAFADNGPEAERASGEVSGGRDTRECGPLLSVSHAALSISARKFGT
jgi:hypothetical protein